ncbi:hypothetical protein RS022_02520 [Candidatus Phytoplasma rubi]|uniref:Uncharacterized protein n=1 Tax=Candidatus Phytoplasma rubi TaxID=399025 RepID=A0ABY7BS21_9MOLU|nr:hypothetical protein [Candidatus Phytoplasma rubi]WAN63213.1 hypothetical protein RS022_02520 [Candidatus Phytoplasma rubi]
MYSNLKKIYKYFFKFFIIIIFFIYFNYNIFKICAVRENQNVFPFFEKIKDNDENIFQKDCSWNYKPVLKYNDLNDRIEIIYNYDYQGKIINKCYIDTNKTHIYQYNDENKIVSIYDFENHKLIKTFEYNNQNKIIISRNHKNKFQTKYKYNKKGQLMAKIKVFSDENHSLKKSIFHYVYNDEGQMINKIHYADIFKRRNKFFSFIYGFKKINFVLYTYKYSNESQRIKKINHLKSSIHSYKYYDFSQIY